MKIKITNKIIGLKQINRLTRNTLAFQPKVLSRFSKITIPVIIIDRSIVAKIKKTSPKYIAW